MKKEVIPINLFDSTKLLRKRLNNFLSAREVEFKRGISFTFGKINYICHRVDKNGELYLKRKNNDYYCIQIINNINIDYLTRLQMIRLINAINKENV